MTTTQIKVLNPASIRKAMAAYGIVVRRCRKMRPAMGLVGLQVMVEKCDVEKAKAWFRDFDIQRVTPSGIHEPFDVNGGEFSYLMGVEQ